MNLLQACDAYAGKFDGTGEGKIDISEGQRK